MNLVDVYTIQEMGHRSSDAVPLVSLVSEHRLVGIQHEVDHLVCRISLEAIAEPVQRHLRGWHSVQHEPLKFQEVVVVDVFVHAPIISTGYGDLLVLVCHLANWLSGAADQLFIQTHAVLKYHKPKNVLSCEFFKPWHIWFMRMHTKNATMYTLHDRIWKCW